MPDTSEMIKRLIDRAEECRALAGIMTDQEAATSYLHLAVAYELLVEQELTLLLARQSGA